MLATLRRIWYVMSPLPTACPFGSMCLSPRFSFEQGPHAAFKKRVSMELVLGVSALVAELPLLTPQQARGAGGSGAGRWFCCC